MRPWILLVTLLAACGSGEAVATEATTPAPPTASAEAALREHAVDVVGSSTVYGVGATVPFPAVLDGMLGRAWEVHNSGLPGDTAQGCLSRWRSTTRPARYGSLVVMCGLNDLMRHGTAADAALALTTMLDEARADGLRVVAVLLQPVKGFTPAQRTELRALNAALKDYCAAQQVACADAYAALDDGTGAIRAEYDSGDGLHLNQAGADVIAALVRPAFP